MNVAAPGSLRCADVSRRLGTRPLGTAPAAPGVLLVELALPWPPDVASAPALREVARAAGATGYRLQAVVPQDGPGAPRRRLVRYSRPAGPFAGFHRSERSAPAGDPDALGAAARELLEAPVPSRPTEDDVVDVLVCTHGSRDLCCGRSGTRVHRDLVALELPGVRVWRTSHLGGHRFAATALVLPDGYAWGWVDANDLAGIATRRRPAAEVADRARGCAGLDDPWAQAADVALLAERGWGWAAAAREAVSRPAPAGPDGAERREVTVTAEVAGRREVRRIVVAATGTAPVPSCGDPLASSTKVQLELRVVGGTGSAP